MWSGVIFKIPAICGLKNLVLWSWNEEISSTKISSFLYICHKMPSPIFPTPMAFLPLWFKIWLISDVVVVLPFVPVIAIFFLSLKSLYDNSISVIISLFFSKIFIISSSGLIPGDFTTKSYFSSILTSEIGL